MITPAIEMKRGRDLVVGDVMSGWADDDWNTITDIRPYVGPLAYLWPEGVSSIGLAGGRLTMGITIGHNDFVRCIARGEA